MINAAIFPKLPKRSICLPETADKAKEISQKMRREYPWCEYAPSVQAVANNYRFLMGRLRMVPAVADAPLFTPSEDAGFTAEDIAEYWHRELGHALLNKLIDEGLCRISIITEGATIHYKVELPVVKLEENETLFPGGNTL